MSDGSFSSVFWTSSPHQQESSSDPWPLRSSPAFDDEAGRTSFGLLDLDALSPCTPQDLCVLDKMILAEFVAGRKKRRALAGGGGGVKAGGNVRSFRALMIEQQNLDDIKEDHP